MCQQKRKKEQVEGEPRGINVHKGVPGHYFSRLRDGSASLIASHILLIRSVYYGGVV